MPARLDHATYLAELRSSGDRLADLALGDLSTPVPSCPGWSLADLVEHTGFVHRWQTEVVRNNPGGFPNESVWRFGPASGESWSLWLRSGVDSAVDVMTQSDPSEPRWTWAGPATAAWFHRRIAQETLVHRIDAELACSVTVSSVAPNVAADGVEEFMDVFMPASVGDSIGGNGESVLLRSSDTDDAWRVILNAKSMTMTKDDPSSSADATISGRAVDLLMIAWGREPLQQVQLTGIHAVIDLFNAAAKL